MISIINQNNFYHSKIMIKNENQSKVIQKLLFKLGIRWNSLYMEDMYKFKKDIKFISINGDRYCSTECHLHINNLNEEKFNELKYFEINYKLLLKYIKGER